VASGSSMTVVTCANCADTMQVVARGSLAYAATSAPAFRQLAIYSDLPVRQAALKGAPPLTGSDALTQHRARAPLAVDCVRVRIF
jgi:ABC-type enterobactin transport system permease subunit